MQKPIHFARLVKDLENARRFLGETHSTMRGDMKSQFGGLLKHLDKHFDEVKSRVPECYGKFRSEHERLLAANQQNKNKFSRLKQKAKDLKKKIADGKLPPPPSLPEVPVDTEQGTKLQSELLQKFLPKHVEADVAGVAWENWNLDGTWTDRSS